jgi:hypothetical protein
LTVLGVGACGKDDEPKPVVSTSDGLLRSQDLSTLRPTETIQDKVEDSGPSWRCTGNEDQQLTDAGWTRKSRGYANAKDHWALSTTLWRRDSGDTNAAIASLKKAVDACKAEGDQVRVRGDDPDWYHYESRSRSGRAEGWRGYMAAGPGMLAEVTLVGLDGHAPPAVFGDLMENATRRAETV